ncbi:uncharacterized protein KY384_000155 [Bacidia gigantensis]|uniref:uncharacterized protein n=1 Tax=Bacidia gigantensis TaxID=2732470 RepID=UPI001D04C71C|nr:uncharacterized protein KY384_000155 [Bacidia gigantensis]KAG8526162.1 hypothetical protein KY384_000155 [Bacidia gigantensis]
MGWLWSSSSNNEPSTTPQPEQSTQPEAPFEEAQTLEPAPTSTSTEPAAPRPRTRDEIANSELVAYLRSLSNPSKDDFADLEDDDDDDDDDDDFDLVSPTEPDLPPSKSLITPRNLYPSTISCHQAFELAFHCQSPGGQILNVYRYGTFRWCGDHWNNWWWCIGTNRNFGLTKEEREEKIRRRYWEQDQRTRRRPAGCMEDILTQRKYRLTTGVFVDGKRPPFRRRMDGDVGALQ